MYGTLISTQTLASTAASVTFSSIPGTYTDLYLVMSARTDIGGNPSANIFLNFNGDVATNYSYRILYGTGSAAASASGTSAALISLYQSQDGSGATASTFGNALVTIPNYAGSTAKTLSSDGVTENNATAANQTLIAGSWTGTAAITSIALTQVASANFVAGSIFSLYGLTHF
jgi:hypothetical protein